MANQITRRWLPVLMMLCATLSAFAQDEYVSDEGSQTTGGLWTELGATKVLPYNLSVSLDAGFRTNEWFDEANRFDIGLGLDWKPTKHWKFGVGYSFLMKYYPTETEYKNSTEREYNYKNPNDREDLLNSSTFLGATCDENKRHAYYNEIYRYQGYNDVTKDYTRVTDSYWRAKHRISVDAAYTQRFWKALRVTLRERYQLTFIPSKEVQRTRTGPKTEKSYTVSNYNALTTEQDLADLAAGNMDAWAKIEHDDEPDTDIDNDTVPSLKTKKSKAQHVLRSRLTFEIDKKGWDWTPYLYIESFNNLGESFHFDKLRLSGGVEYALSKQHKISLGYVFNHENDDDGDMNIHAISVGYCFKF